MATKKDKILLEIEETKNKLKQLNVKLDKCKQNEKLKCVNNVFGKGCEKSFRIGDLEFIQTHYYVPPSGCSGGAYWRETEGQFICPNCNHRNRMINHHNYKEKDLEEIGKTYKHLFKSVVDEYKD